MKNTIISTIALTVAAAFAPIAQAQGRHDDPGKTHGTVRVTSAGVIKRIDAPGKKITLEHESIGKFKLEAATHEFQVNDLKSLAKLNEGDKVDFVLEKSGRNLVVIQLRKPG